MNVARVTTSEHGSMLVVAMIAACATIVLGITLASIGDFQSDLRAYALDQIRAQAIAESGLEEGYCKFIEEGGAVGSYGPFALAGGEHSFTVSTVGTDYDIISVGTFGSQSFTFTARAELDAAEPGPIEVELTGYAGQALYISQSTVSWTGDLLYAIDAGGFSGSSVSGSHGVGSIPAFTIDTSEAAGRATTVLDPGTTLSGAVLTGVVYCPGDLFLQNGVTLNGMLVVDGFLQIDGRGAISILNATEGETVILVKGNCELLKHSQLLVDGAIFAEGWIHVMRETDVQITGSLVAGGDLEFFKSTATIDYDPAIMDDPPTLIDGGPRGVGAGGSLVELWRIPSRSPCAGSAGGATEAPPDDDPETTDTENAPWGDADEEEPEGFEFEGG